MNAPATKADALRIESSGVEVHHLAMVGAISGVAPLVAAGKNGPGRGKLRSTGDGTLISYQAPDSSTYGDDVDVSAGGTFLLVDGEDIDKWIRVTVTAAFLLSGPATAEVSFADVYTNAISSDDVAAGEASAGDVETYTVDLANDGTDVLERVKAWLDAAVSGIEISDDGAAWVSPTTEGTALDLADILAGSSVTLHLRRTIGAATPSDPDVLNHVHIAFDGAP